MLIQSDPSSGAITRLERLGQFLNYELSTAALFFLYYFSMIGLPIIILAAIIFAPYMLFVLFKEKKNLWIIFFMILVLIPAGIIPLFFFDSAYFNVFMLIPLTLFYFFCFMLKFSVRDWIAEYNWKRQRTVDKMLKDEIDSIMDKDL